MLKKTALPAITTTMLVLCSSVLAGCGTEAEQLPSNNQGSIDQTATTPAPTRVAIAGGSWDDGAARSRSVLLEWQPHAVVAVVRSATDNTTIPGPQIPLITQAPGLPNPVLPELRPRYKTRYDVEITRVVSSPSLTIGDILTLQTTGAIIDGVEYSDFEDPLMLVGEQYVFFLVQEDWGWGAGPYGRMRLDSAQRLVPVAERWSSLPAILELTCLTVDEAEPLILAAAAESPPLYGAPPSTPNRIPRVTCD